MTRVDYVYNYDSSVPVVTSNRGDMYEGPLIDGKAEGLGKFTYADGSGYMGSFRAGKREGIGKQIWADGDMYEGGFKADIIEGIGKYSWADGRHFSFCSLHIRCMVHGECGCRHVVHTAQMVHVCCILFHAL